MSFEGKPIDGMPAVPGLSGVGGSSPASGQTPANGEVQGAEFSRILDELLAAASRLAEKAEEPQTANPQGMQDAVAEAKQSLESALNLGEGILEAFRRAQIQENAKKP